MSNLGTYLGALLFVILGVALGLTAVGALSPLQKADLLKYLGGFLGSVQGGAASGPPVMRLALQENLQALAIAFLLGLSVVGLPVVAMLLLLRGFVVGFSTAFLAEELGAKGYVLVAVGVMPANLLVVPAMMVLAVGAFRFASGLFRTRLKSRSAVVEEGLRYGAVAAAMAAVVVAAAGIESYVSPMVLSALWPYVGG